MSSLKEWLAMYTKPYRFIQNLDTLEKIPRRYLRLFFGMSLRFRKPTTKLEIWQLEDHQKSMLCSQLLITSLVSTLALVLIVFTISANTFGKNFTYFGSAVGAMVGLFFGLYPSVLAVYIYRNQNR